MVTMHHHMTKSITYGRGRIPIWMFSFLFLSFFLKYFVKEEPSKSTFPSFPFSTFVNCFLSIFVCFSHIPSYFYFNILMCLLAYLFYLHKIPRKQSVFWTWPYTIYWVGLHFHHTAMTPLKKCIHMFYFF